MPALDDYTKLITSEHRDKPKYLAMIGVYAQFFVDLRTTIEGLPAAFDVDTAVGVQLDACGAWVGVTRIVTVVPSPAYPTPSTPYQVVLTDAVFRRLVKARAKANAWDGTPAGILPILAEFYGPAGSYAAEYDNEDMSITLFITGAFPSAAEAAVFSQFILPVRPSGVWVRDTYIVPTIGGPLFGLDVDNAFIGGPDHGSFGVSF